MTASPDSTFHVSLPHQDEPETVESRTEAVELARAMSLDQSRSVIVERDDGRVKMVFREGGLIEYAYETRAGRRLE